MITVSKLAASILLLTVRETNLLPDESIRLTEDHGEFSLSVDVPGDGDRVVRYKGEVVLIVDKTLEKAIGDARIDIEETREGNNLIMHRHSSSAFPAN